MTNWDILERLWEHAEETRLRARLSDHPVLLAEKPFNRSRSRMRYTVSDGTAPHPPQRPGTAAVYWSTRCEDVATCSPAWLARCALWLVGSLRMTVASVSLKSTKLEHVEDV